MVKSDNDVIKGITRRAGVGNKLTFLLDFNEVVNMTADELEKWLKGSKSKKAGWQKDDNSGEAIGHESYPP